MKNTASIVLILFVLQSAITPVSGYAFGTTPLRIAVLESEITPASERVNSQMTEQVRSSLSENKSLDILSKEETEKMFLLYRTDYEKKSLTARENRLVKEAKDLYFKMELQKASETIERGIREIRSGPEIGLFSPALMEAYLTQGMIAAALGEEDLARSSFREAIRLDPDRHLEPEYFPPKLVRLFEKERDALQLTPKESVTIESFPPAAEVFVNGVSKGLTPLTLSALPEGSYWIKLATPHYQDYVEKMTVSSGEAKTIKVSLSPESSARPSEKKVNGYRASDFSDREQLIESAGGFGRMLRSDKVLLISTLQEGDWVTVSGRVVDPKLSTSHPVKQLKIQRSDFKTADVASLLSIDLAAEIHRDIMEEPKLFAEEPSVGIPTLMGRRRTPYYKRKSFWTALALMAGGGIAGGFAASGGDESGTGTVTIGLGGGTP